MTDVTIVERFTSIGLLVLRVSAGSMMLFGHGLGKVLAYSERALRFPDPLGVGHETSMLLAIFGEFVCAFGVIVGLATRASAFAVAFTMFVAAMVVHMADAWAKKELAVIYGVVFLTLVFTGGGRYSLDGKLVEWWTRMTGRASLEEPGE